MDFPEVLVFGVAIAYKFSHKTFDNKTLICLINVKHFYIFLMPFDFGRFWLKIHHKIISRHDYVVADYDYIMSFYSIIICILWYCKISTNSLEKLFRGMFVGQFDKLNVWQIKVLHHIDENQKSHTSNTAIKQSCLLTDSMSLSGLKQPEILKTLLIQ